MEPGLQIELSALLTTFLDRIQNRVSAGIQDRAKLSEKLRGQL